MIGFPDSPGQEVGLDDHSRSLPTENSLFYSVLCCAMIRYFEHLNLSLFK